MFSSPVPAGYPAPARLAIGVISAGRVGTAVGAALERQGHVVSALVARSDRARELAAQRLPEARIAEPIEVARSCELLLLAVPDTALPGLVAQLAEAGAIRRGHIVLHTAGALGWTVLAPFRDVGAVVLAAHPAMTFTGGSTDLDRLSGCAWAVTAPDEVALAVAQMLVMEAGGHPVTVDESARGLYHAALAHGANHLVTLVNDSVDALRAALAAHPGGGVDSDPDGLLGPDPDGLAERMLGPLLRAALDNALSCGDAALTGPVMRGDAATVARHLDVLEEFDPALSEGYRAMALRTARRHGAGPDLVDLLDPEFTGRPT